MVRLVVHHRRTLRLPTLNSALGIYTRLLLPRTDHAVPSASTTREMSRVLCLEGDLRLDQGCLISKRPWLAREGKGTTPSPRPLQALNQSYLHTPTASTSIIPISHSKGDQSDLIPSDPTRDSRRRCSRGEGGFHRILRALTMRSNHTSLSLVIR